MMFHRQILAAMPNCGAIMGLGLVLLELALVP
jgi:hypothetical protein